jgi:hypothetical protein
MKAKPTKDLTPALAIIDQMRDLVQEYEPKMAKLQAMADEARNVNEKKATREGVDLEGQVLDELIKARTEYVERLDALRSQLDEASQKLFDESVITPGYYRAAHSKDVHDVLLQAWQPKRAALVSYKKHDVMVSSLELGNGEFLKTYWFGGIPAQEGIMLPQYIRKLWTMNPSRPSVRFNVRDYMELRGLDNSTRTSENIIEECFRLAKTYFSFETTDRELRGFAMVEAHRLEGGEMEITLSKGLRDLLTECGRQFHQYPDPLFLVNMNNNPHSWELGMYISDRKSMLWKYWDGPSALFTTLELWAATTLPTEAEAKTWGSQYIKEIVRKLERDLSALDNVVSWKYKTREGGQKWTRGWKEWKSASVEITWKANPYDSMDKKAARELEKKKREVRILEAEKQKVKRGKGKK